MFKAYQRCLVRYPVLMQAAQAGLLMAGGDAIAQTVIEKRSWKDYDTMRSVKFFGIGFIVVVS
jgi:hypothetical protein